MISILLKISLHYSFANWRVKAADLEAKKSTVWEVKPDKRVGHSVLLVGKASNLLWEGCGLLALVTSQGNSFISLPYAVSASVPLSTVGLCDWETNTGGIYMHVPSTKNHLGSEVN